MWAYLLKGLFWLFLSIIFRPKSEQPEPPQPGEFELPLSSEGSEFSRIWGTVYQKKFHVHWHGHKRQIPIKSETGKKG